MSGDRAGLAARMSEAAGAWLASLSPEQLAPARSTFPAEDERTRWFYTPVDHGGLPIGAMTARQQQLAHRLVASGLSHPGYVTVAVIMGMENVLDAVEGWRAGFGRERGRDPGLYWLRVFGDPAGDGWGWRFGGHHVSLNYTIIDRQVRSTVPCFLGLNPASQPLLGPHALRPLGDLEDLGRQLVLSFDDEQADRAVICPVAPTDLATGNRPVVSAGDLPLPLRSVMGDPAAELATLLDAAQARDEAVLGWRPEHGDRLAITAAPIGLPVDQMTPSQQELLWALLDCYTGRMPDEVAEADRARVRAEPAGSLAFAWAGDRLPGAPHYYRIQGTRLLAEYDNTQNEANHVHAVWRDIQSDFGRDVLAEHYANDH